jgi:hypothetical protein
MLPPPPPGPPTGSKWDEAMKTLRPGKTVYSVEQIKPTMTRPPTPAISPDSGGNNPTWNIHNPPPIPPAPAPAPTQPIKMTIPFLINDAPTPGRPAQKP